MKRFLRWDSDYYYPSGAAHDFVGDFDSLDEAFAVRSVPLHGSEEQGSEYDFTTVLDTNGEGQWYCRENGGKIEKVDK